MCSFKSYGEEDSSVYVFLTTTAMIQPCTNLVCMEFILRLRTSDFALPVLFPQECIASYHTGLHCTYSHITILNKTGFVSFICRAVYSDADLYLLDGPLSAVDPEIEHHLFEECIRDLLDNSAVVLVTHQLAIAQLSDQVMVLKEVRAIQYRYLRNPCAFL